MRPELLIVIFASILRSIPNYIGYASARMGNQVALEGTAMISDMLSPFKQMAWIATWLPELLTSKMLDNNNDAVPAAVHLFNNTFHGSHLAESFPSHSPPETPAEPAGGALLLGIVLATVCHRVR